MHGATTLILGGGSLRVVSLDRDSGIHPRATRGLLLVCKGDGNHRVGGSLSQDGSIAMMAEVVLGPRSAQGCSESGMWLRGAGGQCKGAVMPDTQLLARGQSS